MFSAHTHQFALMAVVAAALVFRLLPAAGAPPPGEACFGRAATITGTDGDNTLTGTAGNDVIVGRGGDDAISGKGGDDLVCSGDGADKVIMFASADKVDLGAGNDIVTLELTAGVPKMATVIGGSGDDTLAAAVSGGVNATALARPAGQPDVELRKGATPLATADASGVEILAGSAENDVIIDRGHPEIAGFFGDRGNDRITGERARDVIDGGSGNDVVAAGFGPDVIVSGPGVDRYDGGPGADVITFANVPRSVKVDLALGTATGDGPDKLAAIESIIGGPAKDTLQGEGGPNVIDGNGGNDTIDGALGNDTLRGGAGDDVITDPGGKNKIEGGDGNDNLRGGVENDFIEGGDGDDKIAGGLVAGQGVDRLYGYKKGPPPAVFVSDDDTIGGSGAFIDGGPGADIISNVIGKGTTYGGPGDDVIKAEGYLDGGEGDDIAEDRDGLVNSVLRGGPGGDLLKPLDGDDRVSGGPGVDTVDYSDVGGNALQIIDLVAGTAVGDAVGNDKLNSIEDVFGAFATAMKVTGNGKANTIRLSPGFGEANGGGGNDTLIGSTAQDTLIGGSGIDSADGDGGFDECDAEAEANCEGTP